MCIFFDLLHSNCDAAMLIIAIPGSFAQASKAIGVLAASYIASCLL